MSQPLYWPFKHFFYPIGNTSATCLTQDLPVEQAADVLLLGCGDPRNILYTMYADLASQGDGGRVLDFTCCDIEPAILARNILLLTLVCSEASLDHIWNVFYHFYLNTHDYELLQSQCRLLAAASVSMRSWNDSPYGAYLKICSTHTLGELRRHWELYSAFSSLPRARIKKVLAAQRELSASVLRDGSNLLSISRSAGIYRTEAVQPMQELFEHYWTTGTMSCSTQDAAEAKMLNPTFAYNLHGEGFVLHYGTFPPQAYHLTAAYAPILGEESPRAPVDVLIAQFKTWCRAFKIAVGSSSRRLVVRFCVADVLSFCKALSNSVPSRLYVSPFTEQALELDGERPPCKYDVIDTSNLVDHIGLLNILVSTKPLMKPSPTSVLYTETLLPKGDNVSAALLGRMCGDVPTVSLLVGLTPRTFLSGFNTHADAHELLFHMGTESGQFHERVAWCDPTAGDAHIWQESSLSPPVVTDAAGLGSILFEVYNGICADERTEHFRDPILRKRRREEQTQNRATFAQLVRLAMSYIVPGEGGWDAAIAAMLDLIAQDRTRIVGLNYYQEFCLQLHLHGIYTTPPLSAVWKSSVLNNATFDVFRGWDDVPSVVCVLLTVPTDRLKVFDGTDGLGSMALLCHLFTLVGYDNAFACGIHAIPGHVERSSVPWDVSVIRDGRGLKEASSLVISFLAPAWLLTIPRTKVMFTINTTPRTAAQFTFKLGPFLEIFSAPLEDTRHVCITKYRPGVFSDPCTTHVLPRAVLAHHSSTNRAPVTVQVDGAKKVVASMTHKVDLAPLGFSSPIARELPIVARQRGACTIELSVGKERALASFPFPVDGRGHKLRVARKSLYVEIVVPPADPRSDGMSKHWLSSRCMFPILNTVGPSPWNVHHVNLDLAPSLDMKAKKALSLIPQNTSCQLSQREADNVQQRESNKDLSYALTVLKLCIGNLIDTSLGFNPRSKQPRIFEYAADETKRAFMLMFVNRIRLDLSSFTLLADVAVVPMDERSTADMYRAALSLPRLYSASRGFLRPDEEDAWRQLLPAVVERCRTWRHAQDCEYTARGRGPIYTTDSGSPICSCGRGIGLPDSIPDVPQAVWDALRPYATRAALSPLFAVAYLEPVVADRISGRLRDMVLGASETGASGGGDDPVLSEDSMERCTACGQPGEPKLLVCGRCKKAKYCSPACNKSDWKSHKLVCRPSV